MLLHMLLTPVELCLLRMWIAHMTGYAPCALNVKDVEIGSLLTVNFPISISQARLYRHDVGLI